MTRDGTFVWVLCRPGFFDFFISYTVNPSSLFPAPTVELFSLSCLIVCPRVGRDDLASHPSRRRLGRIPKSRHFPVDEGVLGVEYFVLYKNLWTFSSSEDRLPRPALDDSKTDATQRPQGGLSGPAFTFSAVVEKAPFPKGWRRRRKRTITLGQTDASDLGEAAHDIMTTLPHPIPHPRRSSLLHVVSMASKVLHVEHDAMLCAHTVRS